MTTRMLACVVLAVCSTACAHAQQAPQQVVLTIMAPQVNNVAPGIDAAVKLTPEQVNQLTALYREVFDSGAAVLANMVLRDSNTTMEQRRVASIALQQAQAQFQARARAIFTEPQQKLIDSVQAAFEKIYQQEQEEFNKRLTGNFSAELDKLLSPEQKQAMMEARAKIEEQRKAQAPPPAN